MASNKNYDSESEEENFNPAPADLSDEEIDEGDTEERHRSDRGARQRSSSVKDEGQEEDDEADARPSKSKRPARDEEEDDEDGIDRGDDDEEEEDEAAGDKASRRNRDDEEDEEEEEDDEDEDVQQGHRRKRRRDRRTAFFDIEAEVDDEDEGEDEERDGEEIEDFIDHAHPDDIAESVRMANDMQHREFDRQREAEENENLEEMAAAFAKRHGRRPRRDLQDSVVMPKRMLLPSVDDPSIWAVRCKEGKEREVVFSIMKRIEERLNTKDELGITCAFERGGPNSVMKGYIYVEAMRQTDIMAALDGMLNVYPRTKMLLVEIKDMPDLLRVTQTPNLEPGAWVRLRKPAKHAGDLAQVLDVTENGLEVRVRFIPRLDYGVRDDSLMTADGKRKRPGVPGPRPPQRLFSEVEARKRQPRHIQGNPQTNTWTYNGDEFEGGFQVKDIKIQQLQVKDVNPTLEEVAKFASGAEDGTENLDLRALAASLKDSNANVTFLPGDVIKVHSGEQKGVVGIAVNVQGDIVTIKVSSGELAGQTIEVPNKGLRKCFNPGDHVKVIGGSRFRDEVGMVVKVTEDGDRVTLLTDQTNSEVTVFSKDLRAADDIGGQGAIGQYALLDLVQLDATTVGCVVKVDRESLVVLDQNGDARQIMPSQITNKLQKRKTAVAADRNGSEIRLDDVVREYGGQQRQGKIIHIHRSFIYLHSNDSSENAGVFVTRSSNVNTIAAKGGRVSSQSSGPDLSAMNPALKRNPNGNGADAMQPPKSFGRDRAIGQTITVRRGGYKGLLGIVKDTTDTHARVELHTKGKIITVPKADLAFKDKFTGQQIDINTRGGMSGRGGFGGGRGRGGFSGGSNNDWENGGSRTPAASGGSDRTPAWGASRSSARTPAWSRGSDVSGSRTPAWGDGSRTVNPYDGSRTSYGGGSRTPAWSSGAKTPAHDGFGHGSKTPAYSGGGGSDAWGAGAKTPAYGVSAPTPGASGNDGWGYTPGASGSSHAYDAPTPGANLSAPTPGAFNAPTPAAYTAPTPAVTAPTPGAWQGGWGADTAPTPAAGAPTPAATGSAYYSAPTPAAFGGAAETPAASGPRYTDDD